MRLPLRLLALIVAAPLVAHAAPGSEHAHPPPDSGAASLPRRAEIQRRAWAASGSEPGFTFADRSRESGITFVNRIVEDAGKRYKAVHYDHGTAVAAADVDGDDRPDLYFVGQLGANGLWRNLGEGRFEDVTASAGVGLADRIGVAASFADADGDGDPDLFVTSVRGGNTLFENLGGGRFRDVTAAAGLAYAGHSSGAVWLDFDRDGRLDLFVANIGDYTTDVQGPGGYWIGREDAFQGHLHPDRTERSLLYRNLGGLRFVEVSTAVGLVDPGWTGDATLADFDLDGYPELYVLNMQGDDRYWRNLAGARFEEARARTFLRTPWGAMGVTLLDADLDGRIDLFVTDMHSDMSAAQRLEEEGRKSRMAWSEEMLQGGADNVFGNALYRNLGNGRFAEVSDRYGVETYWPWGVSAGDVDADGDEDLFVTGSMNYPYPYHPSSLLLNREGRGFLAAEMLTGVEPRPGGVTHAPWFDLRCTGEDRDHPLCREDPSDRTVTGALGARSSVLVDVDGDGDLDLVANELNGAPRLLVNDAVSRGASPLLRVVLVGSVSNRDGLGALVTVRTGSRSQVRLHHGKSGYLAQSSLPLAFGLGREGIADEIAVRWPSGIEQVVHGPFPAGERIEIVEPAPVGTPGG